MKKKVLYSLLCLVLFLTTQPAMAQATRPEAGELLPAFSIKSPKQNAEKQYLGIGDSDTFSLDQVDAELVIVEIFSMYCPYCQKEAPVVNRLYERIASDSNLREKIRMIGIGIGNSVFEVGFFKKTYKIEFPMLPDSDFAIHKALGQVRTPFFIVASRDGNGNLRVIHTKPGSIYDPEQFLEKIVGLAGLK